MQKFVVRVKDRVNGNEWDEQYEKDVEKPEEWAKQVTKQFNETLQPNENPRDLVSVKVVAMNTRPNHDWGKTNLVTVSEDGLLFNEYACRACGVTGRRYELDSDVILDREFKAKVYARCDTAEKHLAKAKKQ